MDEMEAFRERWVCCCEIDPPRRCGPCDRGRHNDCLSKHRVVAR